MDEHEAIRKLEEKVNKLEQQVVRQKRQMLVQMGIRIVLFFMAEHADGLTGWVKEAFKALFS